MSREGNNVIRFNRMGTKPSLDRMTRILEPVTYPDRKLNKERRSIYDRMCNLAQQFDTKGFWTVSLDDPELKTNSHMIRAKFIEDDFDGEDAKNFVELLGLSDGFMFFGDNEGNTSIVIQLEGIYQ